MAFFLRKHWIEILWFLCIPWYVWGGTRPDGYAIAMLGGQPPYPLQGVLTAIAVTAAESLVLYGIIRPKTYQRSWLRAVGALFVFLPWLLVSAILVMHASPVVLMHLVWVFVANVVLIGLCLSAAIQGAIRALRGHG